MSSEVNVAQVRNPVFTRVAIINRGEPAMRLIRAVRQWNRTRGEDVRTVALFTEPDREALCVREADSAYALGSAMFLDNGDLDENGKPRRKSRYLDYPALREALTRTKADAAWVGWGFVSEHAAFADLCAELGVVFIGPPAEAMRRLGGKIESKLLAESAGVPVAPWSGGPVTSVEEARAHAERIGYPLLVKATAGGGGRGIRFVDHGDQLAAALASATSEARRSFGDGTVFLEKRVGAARHVEVQVLADDHGTVWPVGVRDCSAQRNNQKVIEEAPSPVLSTEQEASLKEAAVRLARVAGYRNAGTVEFLFDPTTGRACFMEMNTRLQVEHPVTEETTGLDLVGLQLAVARGERLPPEPPPTRGHAIEVRLCAEDPDRLFAPAPGRVVSFRPPLGPGIRTDSGIREGDRVPVEFDSMVAKIIAHGATREEARARLACALEEALVVVEGGTTNRAFLLRLLHHPDFVASRFDTSWLDRLVREPAGPGGGEPLAALVATAIRLHLDQLREEELNFFASAARGRPLLPAPSQRPVELRHGGHAYAFQVRTLEPGVYRVHVDGSTLDVRLEQDGPFESRLTYDTPEGPRRHRVVNVPAGMDHRVEVDGRSCRVSRDPGGVLRAPAPGIVFGVHVEEGAVVRAGDRLLGLEAMKMEMPVTAPYAGRVRKVLVGQGVQVSAGDGLVVLEPEGRAGGDTPATPRVAFPSLELPSHNGHVVRELRRLMLGFDISEERVAQLLAASHDAEPSPDDREVEAKLELLATYADVESPFSKTYADDVAALPGGSHERWLHLYLREVHAEGRGLPAPFLQALRAALARYGVAGLGDTPRLRETLVQVHRSHQNVARKNTVVVALVQSLDRPGCRERAAQPAVRACLDRLITLTRESFPSVCEAAQRVRYELFDRRVLETRRRTSLDAVDGALARLVADPASPQRAILLEEILSTPYSLAEHLLPKLAQGDNGMRSLLLEVMARRFYRTDGLGQHCELNVGGVVQVLSRREDGSGTCALSTWTRAPDPDNTVQALLLTCAQASAPASVLVDLYVDVDRGPDPEEDASWLAGLLAPLGAAPQVDRVSAYLCHAGATLGCFTFCRRGGAWSEDTSLRGFHPTASRRLELWRMRHFHVRRVATSGDLHLFHARARENERDERLWAVAEVRDVRPVRDDTGRLVELPNVEHAVLEAFHAIRDQQSRRDARQRLHWNRVTVFLRQPILAARDDLLAIGQRLYGSAHGLGLEKLSLRLTLQESATQLPRDTVVSFTDRTGRVSLAVAAPHQEPLRVLDDYALKVVRARQRKASYVYEVVKMLAPAEPAAGFPAGTFEEHDLGHNGDSSRLVSVKGRPHGLNTANVVVGVLRSITQRVPEGVTRVAILGDATRDMGALAEPECARVMAALDLAERMRVPVEWYPVSSGARIAMDSGTENLDWTAAVLKRIIEFTQAGGEINIVVDGINVGAQSYWNAEATMLMHCRGCLVMTPRGSMLLTGKRALDYSGGVSAEDNLGIGGFERVMGPNGQAQYHAQDLDDAARILLRHYDHTYVVPGEHHPRPRPTTDAATRDVRLSPYVAPDGGFQHVGDLWDDGQNPGRKKPFDIRTVMRAVVDQDSEPLERWGTHRDAEVAVVWDAHLGGRPACVIGVESKSLPRLGAVPSDGPDAWSGGTLFPLASKKVARAINAASGNRPVVVLANLSGFDGSPESLRRLQLEYGAEIGRAVVNFRGPLVFCVVVRYHGGAYVVFSKRLNPSLRALALHGSHASVIGGAPAAAVVFPEEARALARRDGRVVEAEARVRAARANPAQRSKLQREYEDLLAKVQGEKQREVAERFDAIHSVDRALRVGSLDALVAPGELRPALIEALEGALRDPPPARGVGAPQEATSS
jgi:acetyl/propionyl-CoA carboxylase alpha subunit/acetyl-CoA carboxylase carboxyltransferase component